jgi:hypothetical protein
MKALCMNNILSKSMHLEYYQYNENCDRTSVANNDDFTEAVKIIGTVGTVHINSGTWPITV